jgi:hypothetical protein
VGNVWIEQHRLNDGLMPPLFILEKPKRFSDQCLRMSPQNKISNVNAKSLT